MILKSDAHLKHCINVGFWCPNLQVISEMDKIVDSHFHIWDFSLRATYPKTDASFDWPDSSLPVIHRNIQVITTKKKVLIGIPIVVLIMTY